jgi:hypothetical protein
VEVDNSSSDNRNNSWDSASQSHNSSGDDKGSCSKDAKGDNKSLDDMNFLSMAIGRLLAPATPPHQWGGQSVKYQVEGETVTIQDTRINQGAILLGANTINPGQVIFVELVMLGK